MTTATRPTISFPESKLMDFLAVAIMLLFTALLFAMYGFPALKDSLGISQPVINTPTSVDSQ